MATEHPTEQLHRTPQNRVAFAHTDEAHAVKPAHECAAPSSRSTVVAGSSDSRSSLICSSASASAPRRFVWCSRQRAQVAAAAAAADEPSARGTRRHTCCNALERRLQLTCSRCCACRARCRSHQPSRPAAAVWHACIKAATSSLLIYQLHTKRARHFIRLLLLTRVWVWCFAARVIVDACVGLVFGANKTSQQ